MLKVLVREDLKITGNKKHLERIIGHIEGLLKFEVKSATADNVKSNFLKRKSNFIYGYMLTEKNALHIPRGFWPRLYIFLEENGIRHYLVDKRVKAPYHRKRRTPPVVLRDYQKNAVKRAVDIGYGVIQAPCGSGKTQILTDIVKQTNQWTLILVHTDDLITQMSDRLQEAFGQPIGIIKQNERIIRPITVASVMTMRRRHLSRKFLNRWGCVMLDESHHMPADSFGEVLRQFPAYYRFGTTATTTREDGLHGLMYATIGYRIFNVTYEELYEGNYLMPPSIVPVDSTFYTPLDPRTRYQQIIRELVYDEDRNHIIVNNLVKEHANRNLILSSRIDHLRIIMENMLKREPWLENHTKLLIGEMSGKDRIETLNMMRSGNLNYIFATQLADEGLDLPILDRLHLIYPTKSERKIQQEVGRIQRIYPEKGEPLVYDYRDMKQPTFNRHWYRRRKVYAHIGGKIEKAQ